MPVGRDLWGHGERKNRGTVTASLCLVCKDRGWNLEPLIKSINDLLPWRINLSNEGDMKWTMCCCTAEFRGNWIQGLQVNIAHKSDSMWLLNWVECETKEHFSDSKKSSKARNLRWWFCKIPERAWVDKICLADLLKIYHGVELDPQERKSSCGQEKAYICLCCYTNPAGQEADRWSKSKHFPENSSEINAILASAAKWWMSLSVTQVVNALLCSDEFYCPLYQWHVAVAVYAESMRWSDTVTV